MSFEIPSLDLEQFKSQVGFFEPEGSWHSQVTSPTLVYFYGNRCPQCQRVKPHLDVVVRNWDKKIHFFKVDTDFNPQLVHLLRIRSIPAFLLVSPNKKPLLTFGFMSEEELVQAIQEKLLQYTPSA